MYARATVTDATWFQWALLSAAFAALTAIFARLGVQAIDSDLATLLRTLVIVLILGAVVVAGHKWVNPMRLEARTLIWLVLSALATGASWVCYFRALKLAPASRVAPVDKFSVVLVALFAAAFLHERLGPRDWLGIGLVGTGVIVLALRA